MFISTYLIKNWKKNINIGKLSTVFIHIYSRSKIFTFYWKSWKKSLSFLIRKTKSNMADLYCWNIAKGMECFRTTYKKSVSESSLSHTSISVTTFTIGLLASTLIPSPLTTPQQPEWSFENWVTLYHFSA